MSTKILLAPTHRGSSFIAAVDGQMRVIDPPKPCMGYANACICESCKERAIAPRTAPEPIRQPWDVAV